MDRTGLSPSIAGAARSLAEKTSKIGSKSKDDVPQSVPKEQYSLAVNLIKAMGVEGTGILVFVSGIADITELTERFEGMSKFQLYAIHSDLPFEEQEAAFTPAAADKVKVRYTRLLFCPFFSFTSTSSLFSTLFLLSFSLLHRRPILILDITNNIFNCITACAIVTPHHPQHTPFPSIHIHDLFLITLNHITSHCTVRWWLPLMQPRALSPSLMWM
jgi:hypothetical protein